MKVVTAWVAYYDEHGEVPPVGKLEGHEDYRQCSRSLDKRAGPLEDLQEGQGQNNHPAA
jgi:hypothetical protein